MKLAAGLGISGSSSRHLKNKWFGKTFLGFTSIPLVLLVILIVVLWRRAVPILGAYPLWQLLSGTEWSPIHGQFGYLPFIMGTVWVTLSAMIIAVPLSLLSAIYLAEYAPRGLKRWLKPPLDVLAGIPSVVYGVWGMIVIVPWVRNVAAPFFDRRLGFIPIFASGSVTTGFSVLAGGIVLAVMVIPIIITVVCEVLDAVPAELREAALALGASRLQAILRCVLRKAAPGILAAVVLGFSRAFGETMAVLMVVGNVSEMPASIFDPATPLTALIANNYGEMLSIPLYDGALMGAALVLLVLVLLFNILSAAVLQRTVYRKEKK
jgi:phosphate transport system permease protein